MVASIKENWDGLRFWFTTLVKKTQSHPEVNTEVICCLKFVSKTQKKKPTNYEMLPKSVKSCHFVRAKKTVGTCSFCRKSSGRSDATSSRSFGLEMAGEILESSDSSMEFRDTGYPINWGIIHRTLELNFWSPTVEPWIFRWKTE